MERHAVQLPPPAPGLLGPGLLIGCALLFGAAGPGWLFASVGGLVSQVPPRLFDWPIPAMLPFVGVTLMVMGVAWYAILRAAATTTEVELVGLRLSIDGEDLQLTGRTRTRREGDRLEVVLDGTKHTLRSEDADALDALQARIRERTRGAGTDADIPRAMQALTRTER